MDPKQITTQFETITKQTELMNPSIAVPGLPIQRLQSIMQVFSETLRSAAIQCGLLSAVVDGHALQIINLKDQVCKLEERLNALEDGEDDPPQPVSRPSKK